MRFLFSEMTASILLGGEVGIAGVSSIEAESPDGACVCCSPRRELESRNGFGVGTRFCGSAFAPGVARAPSLLPGRCKLAPIDTERDLRAAIRSIDGRLGCSSSGSRFTRRGWRFCDEDNGREVAIN